MCQGGWQRARRGSWWGNQRVEKARVAGHSLKPPSTCQELYVASRKLQEQQSPSEYQGSPGSAWSCVLPKGHSDSTGSGTDGVLVHLSRGGAEVQIFAPNVPQMHVIDHTKGQPSESETRNVLAESARIARGKITDLAQLSAANHDAAIFPGGFGAAKNLSTFAVDGKDCKVNKDVERVLKDFHKAGKPIGLCCIAPVLAAKVLPGVEVTVGHEQEEGGKWPYAGTAEAIKAMGAKHCVKGVTEAHVDQKNKVVTTPAFMCETALHHIHDGIGAMVTKVLELARK